MKGLFRFDRLNYSYPDKLKFGLSCPCHFHFEWWQPNYTLISDQLQLLDVMQITYFSVLASYYALIFLHVHMV